MISILALVTSGGVVGSIFSFDEKYIAAVLGAIRFLGSLLVLLVKWLKSGVTCELNLGDAFNKLSEYSWDARSLKAELDKSTDHDEFEDIINRTNQLARDIYLVLGELGYQADLHPL